MPRNISKPFYPAGFEFDVGVKPSGHGLIDDVLLLFLEQFDKPLFVADEFIDLGGFAVEKTGDLCLFFFLWNT